MMDIRLINEIIDDLETGDTTFDSVRELSSLYVVRDHLMKPMNNVESELSDILPTYKEYCRVKRTYQLNGTSDDLVIRKLKNVCSEIIQFINTLYSSTDMPKERQQIETMLESLQEKYLRKSS